MWPRVIHTLNLAVFPHDTCVEDGWTEQQVPRGHHNPLQRLDH